MCLQHHRKGHSMDCRLHSSAGCHQSAACPPQVKCMFGTGPRSCDAHAVLHVAVGHGVASRLLPGLHPLCHLLSCSCRMQHTLRTAPHVKPVHISICSAAPAPFSPLALPSHSPAPTPCCMLAAAPCTSIQLCCRSCRVASQDVRHQGAGALEEKHVLSGLTEGALHLLLQL